MNFDKREKEILDFWKKEKIFKKSLNATKNSKSFVFYDGPITVNAKPGIHHVEARVYKDIVNRYKTMQGFYVERKNGWDTHGLPVELQVEKKLGFKSKKDIERYGVARFNKKCQESVDELIPVFRQMTERIGYWIDMDNPYITYKSEYIESLWWILKQIWERKLLYQDFKIIPWCYRCGTGLSSHELAQGYRNIRENSVYIKFQVIFNKHARELGIKEGTHILSWTTTPWTLPGNVALAINVKMTYVLVKKNNQYYLLAKSRIKVLENDYQVIKEFTGNEIKGISYKPLFKITELQTETSYKIYGANFVSEEDGTGIVHVAVMYGIDDFEMGNKYNLPKIHTVSEEGKFNKLVKGFEGKIVKNKETEKELISYLKENKTLLKQEAIFHDYPFCWRCKTPLLYYAKDSWFIRVSDIQKELLEANQRVNWIPGHLKNGRFGEWLNGIKDWAITRERYWGTPFPVWKCQGSKTQQCKNTKVIGSYTELEELSGQKLQNPHKPYIDEITFKCDKCGGIMKREPFVIDVWFDSGAMPFAQYHYPFEQGNKKDSINKNLKEKIKRLPFPADYISEAIDQTRGWFYTLMTVSVLLKYSTPYKNVLCLGHVLDNKGEKMSKSKGNIVEPNEIINKYGADALRWYFFTINQPGDPKRFNEKDVRKALSRLLLLENSLNFLKFYIDKNTRISLKEIISISPNHILDKWLLAKLKQTQKNVTKDLDQFEIVSAARKIDEFINNLSSRYIHWSRIRLKGSKNKKSILVLMKAIFELAKLIAPFTPFLAENIYQTFKNDILNINDKNTKQSIHLEIWSSGNKLTTEEQKIINSVNMLDNFISLGLRARKNQKIKVRQPLSEIKLNFDIKSINSVFVDIIKDELNIKTVSFSQKIQQLPDWIIDTQDNQSVALNIKINDQLRLEGFYREILRNIQILRKQMGLFPKDKIVLYCDGGNDVIKNFGNKIKLNTNTSNIVVMSIDTLSLENKIELKINDEIIKIAIKKV